MNIKCFTFNPFMENTYVLSDESKEAVIEEIRKKNSPSEYWKTVKSVTLKSEDDEMVLHEIFS